MGKKASLKVDVDFYVDGYGDFWDDEDRLLVPRQQSLASIGKRPSSAVRKLATVHGTLKGSKNNGSTNTPGLKNYHKKPAGRPFSKLLLEHGHDVLIYHLAAFLEIRDITALSCVNRQLEKCLSNEKLYYSKSTILLPCMRACPVPRLKIPRLARALAFEYATLFRLEPGSMTRERKVKQLANILCEGSIVKAHLSASASKIAYLLDNGRLQVHSLDRPKETVSTPAMTKELVDSAEIFAAYFTNHHCVVLAMPLAGTRRLQVSLGSTSSTMTRKDWKRDLMLPIPTIRGSCKWASQAPRMAIDEHRRYIIVTASGYFWVLSFLDGNVIWETDVEHRWQSLTLHKGYLVVTAGKGKKKQHLFIYSIEQQRLVASGYMPTEGLQRNKAVLPSEMDVAHGAPPDLFVYADRIWITFRRRLICTGCIFRRLRSMGSTDEDCVPQILRIKLFHRIADLQSNTAQANVFRGAIYVTERNLVKIYRGGDLDLLEAQGDLTPRHVIAAHGEVEHIHVDGTKIICTISTDVKHRVEVFLNPEILAPDRGDGAHGTTMHSIEIKTARVFRNQYELEDASYVNGRLLLVQAGLGGSASSFYEPHARVRVLSLVSTENRSLV